MSVGEICNRETVLTSKDASILETAQLMREQHVGSVVVVDQAEGLPKPVGIVTDRDLVIEVMAKDVDLDDVTIGDVMSFDIVTAAEDDGIWDTIQRMRARGVRRVPVVDSRGSLAGILSMDDVLDFLVEELWDLARLVKREQAKEDQTRSVP